MAMISITVRGIDEVTHALDQWVGEVKAPRIMFVNLVSDVIVPDIRQRFENEGPGWAPLSPAYADWKAANYPGQPILVQTGAMRAALTDASRFGGAQSQFAPNVLTLDPSDIPYFATHQFGRGAIPARPMIDLQALAEPIRAYIEKWLTGRARDFGLTKGGG